MSVKRIYLGDNRSYKGYDYWVVPESDYNKLLKEKIDCTVRCGNLVDTIVQLTEEKEQLRAVIADLKLKGKDLAISIADLLDDVGDKVGARNIREMAAKMEKIK